MIRRRIDSKIKIWDASYVNNYFMRSQNDKRLEIEQIEPCGNLFIVEVFDKEPNCHQTIFGFYNGTKEINERTNQGNEDT